MRTLFSVLLAILLFCGSLFPQTWDDSCTIPYLNKDAIESQIGGLYKPSTNAPGQYLRVLVVFVEFQNDTRTSGDWPMGQIPSYANSLFDTIAASSYRAMTFSDYWKTMSNGNFDLIGDIYPQVVRLRPESYYSSNGYYFQHANKDVLDSINGKVDFKRYDNWGISARTGQYYFNARNADGYLDMMMIVYREPSAWFTQIPGNSEIFTGIAELGETMTYTTSDGVIIDGNGCSELGSGITWRKGMNVYQPGFVNLMNHELGHYLLGTYHSNDYSLMVGSPYPSGGRPIAMNAWERERLGYLAFTTVSQDSFSVYLGDYITTAQAVKVPITGSTSRYFIVENHQRLNRYDQIARGGSLGGAYDTTTAIGKGIYTYLVENGENTSVSFYWKTANGNWDWALNGTINMPAGWPSVMPLSGRTNINRTGGKSDRFSENIIWNGHWWEKWHDTVRLTKQNTLTRSVMGLQEHAFNYNYNKLLTPYSCPSTYASGTTNISMQLYSQNGNYITLKFYNTAASALELPPSRPMTLKVSSVNNFAVLRWDANIEPDMLKTQAKYKIYCAASLTGSEPTNYVYRDYVWAYANGQPVTTWTDPNYYVGVGPSKLFYKVTAVDSSAQESDFSDYDWVAYDNAVQKKGVVNTDEVTIKDYALFENYPNPFNPSTIISYQIPTAGFVTLKVYDMLGREVALLVNEQKETGRYAVEFSGANLSSGIYIYALECNGFRAVKKFTLLK